MIKKLIADHLAAVHADEAAYDEIMKAESGSRAYKRATERSAKTWRVEIDAFRALVDAPCRTKQEVQIKLNYFLNGTVGERDTLLDCLWMDEYFPEEDGCLSDVCAQTRFLQSLRIRPAGGGTRP